MERNTKHDQALQAAIPSRLALGLYVMSWTIIVGVLLESRVSFPSVQMNPTAILVIVMVMAVVNAAASFFTRKWSPAMDQLFTLVSYFVFITFVVLYSDGLQSPFYPLYYIAVIMAAVSFGITSAVATATAAVLLVIAMEAASADWHITEALVLVEVLRTFPYLFLIAAITGAMRNRVQALTEAAAALRADRDTINREMEVARTVQRAQLPAEVPLVPGVEIALLYEPAREVGGDFYDFYPVAGKEIGIAVADVAGKGVPAALLIASGKYSLREHASPDRPQMMHAINEHLMTATTDDTFVTMLYGVLDTDKHDFAFVNAGHMPPIVLRASTGAAQSIGGTDVPLGVMPTASYDETVIHLQEGDTLVLYTDGISDALGKSSDGVEELQRFLSALANVPLREWPERLRLRLADPIHVDDQTLVAVRLV